MSSRTSHFPGGFTYVALLVAIVIIGISLGAAGKNWSHVMQREREEELLFRGEQYRLAIERYYLAKAPNLLPPSIDELLSDSRFPQARRHLRQKFKDPVTGEDFELVRDKLLGNRISGVFSASEKTPLKTTGFPEELQSFEGKTVYSEWKFVYAPPRPAQVIRSGIPPGATSTGGTRP
ncbi:MAG: type II secretion system protein [Nitrospirota bacterium]